MSETNIPEQRAVEVGQRRRNHKEIFTIYAIEGSHAIICRAGQTDPVTDYIHKGDESCCWESISVLADCEIVADAPAIAPLAVDRTGCKAWCGRTDQLPGFADNLGGGWQADFRYWDPADGETPTELAGKPMWCNSTCRNARVPPLAAQPSETLTLDAPCPGQCGGGAAANNGPCIRCKPAPQPAPAKLGFSFTDKEDRIHRFATANERDSASRAYWSWMAEQTGKPYTGPEHIERPRLAHQAGNDWDFLEDVK